MREFSDFLLDLYRLARVSTLRDFRPAAMALMRPVVPFDSGRWMHGLRDAPGSFVPHGGMLLNESPDMLAAYREVRSQDRIAHELMAKGSGECVGVAYRSRSTYEGRGLAGMREYQQRFAHENVLNVVINHVELGERHWRFMALYRKSADHVFSGEELALTQRIWPHLLEAELVNRLAHLHAIGVSSSATDRAIAIAEDSRRILFASERAQELLKQEWPGGTGGRIPAALWDCLARNAGYEGHQIVASAQRVQDMVILRIRSRCCADRLSAREIDVARRVAAGWDHKTIARDLGIALTTTRNHQQNIYRKLGVHNAAALVDALQPLRLDAGPRASLHEQSVEPPAGADARIAFETA